MKRLCSNASGNSVYAQGPKKQAVRTYEEIARILIEREGVVVSAARVAQICRGAELKFIRALLSDPEVRAQLRPSAWHLGV